MLAGRYRLIEQIGAGGMSVVWRGYDEILGRTVAVKVLSSALSAQPSFRTRLRREARAAAQLSHPCVVAVYDFGEVETPHGAVPFIVMELLPGINLATVLARGPLPWPTAVAICAQVAQALTAAHQRGLVHQDVTASNVLVTSDGVKVLDFGISSAIGEWEHAEIFGTPPFLSPERLRGSPADSATDVYALGILLYLCLTATFPPTSASPPISEGFPAPVADLIERCLADDPVRRPSSREIVDLLAAVGDEAAISWPIVTMSEAPAAVGPHGTHTLDPLTQVALPTLTPHSVRPTPRKRLTVLMAIGAAAGCALAGLWLGELRHSPQHQVQRHVQTAPVPPIPSVSPSTGPMPSEDPASATATATTDATAGVTVGGPPPDQSACSVTYRISSQWNVGFGVNVQITNIGPTTIRGWTLSFRFPDAQQVVQLWNGTVSESGGDVSVSDAGYNERIEPGQAITFGFNGSYTNENDPPSAFVLNGVTCGVGAH